MCQTGEADVVVKIQYAILKAERQTKQKKNRHGVRQSANRLYKAKVELVSQNTMNKIMNQKSNMKTIR